MLVLTQPLQSLTILRTYRFTTCWRIARKDGVVIRVTTHNGTLTVPIAGTNEVFSPIGAMDPSARQKLSQLKERNLECKGMFDVAAMTFDDLRAGRYRGAAVTEYIVDWKYPWLGPIEQTVYFMGATQFNGEYWEAHLDGFTTNLKRDVGRTYGRMCDATLGDSRCTLNLAPFTFTGLTVTAVLAPRQSFTSSATQADAYFGYGNLTWTSGANAGLTVDIEYYINSGGTFQLLLYTPSDFAPGDTFTAVGGCDRTLPTCRDRFNNIINYQGFPAIPGTDVMIRSPNFYK